jgi:uncharacterized protein (DUF697 family)
MPQPRKKLPSTTKQEPVMDDTQLTKEQQALKITRRYMLWSVGAGLIPIPVVDITTMVGVQMKMVAEISKIYDVSFSENKAKNTISAALSGATASTFAQGTIGSSLKAIPFAGSLIGMITMPFFASASAYALGTVFINHFEQGGTFLDLDSEKFKSNFKVMFSKGEKVAKDLKEEVEGSGEKVS